MTRKETVQKANFYLYPSDIATIKREAKKQKVSHSEIVRRSIKNLTKIK